MCAVQYVTRQKQTKHIQIFILKKHTPLDKNHSLIVNAKHYTVLGVLCVCALTLFHSVGTSHYDSGGVQC